VRSALAQPGAGLADRTLFYPTLHEQAAVLLYHVIKAHACIDGNKRIGVTLMLLFIEINGWRAFFPEREVEAIALYAADSEPSERDDVLDKLSSWIELRIQRSRPSSTGTMQ
jgi:death on curing protein